MPINGVIDLQRRSLPLGEIRIGESEPVPGKKYRKPVRRKTFLFTTPVEETAHAIAAKFGGTPQPWDRREGYWKVDTDQSVIEVWVPPRGLAVDAWMELWDGGKCRRRCDGITETRSGQPCMCPQPDDRTDPALVLAAANKRKQLAGLTPPQACKPSTRINVQIPGLPGVTGVWVLRTGSANAAVETADTGEVLARARDMDVYLPALLLIHWRPGQDGHPYPVPVLRLRPSAEQIGQLPAGMDGMLTQLHSGSEGQLALTGGTPAEAEPDDSADAEDDPEALAAAQRVADDATNATTREEIAAHAAQAKRDGLMGYQIRTPGVDDTYEDLHDYLDAQWRKLPAAQAAPAPRRQRRADGPQEAHTARPPSPVTSPAGDGGSLFDDPGWAEHAEAGR